MKRALLVLGMAACLARAEDATPRVAPAAIDLALQKGDEAYIKNYIAYQIETSPADAAFYFELARNVEAKPWLIEGKRMGVLAGGVAARADLMSQNVEEWRRTGSSTAGSTALKIAAKTAYVGAVLAQPELALGAPAAEAYIDDWANSWGQAERAAKDRDMKKFIREIQAHPDHVAEVVQKIRESKSDLGNLVQERIFGRIEKTQERNRTAEELKRKDPNFILSERFQKVEAALKLMTDEKGNIRFDEEKLKKLFEKALGPVNKELAKQKKTLAELLELAKLSKEERDKEMARRQEAEDAKTAAADYQRIISGAASSVAIASTIAQITGHKELGRQMSAVGNGAIELVAACKNFNDNLHEASKLPDMLNGALGSLNLASSVLSIGMKIFSSFFGGGPPPLNQFEILKAQLMTVRREVADLRVHLDTQFDRVDNRINEALKHIDQRFDDVEAMVRVQNTNFVDLNKALTDIRFTLNVLEARMLSYAQSLANRDFVNRVGGCLSFSQTWPDRSLPFARFQDCLDSAEVYATQFSLDAISNVRDDLGNFDERDLLIDLRTQPERSLGYLAQFADWLNTVKYPDGSNRGFYRFKDLANPVVWSTGAQVFMNLARQYPEYFQASSPGIMNKIFERGYMLRAFTREITSANGEATGERLGFFKNLLRFYEESVSQFTEALKRARKNLQINHKTRGYDIHKEKVEKSAFNPFMGRIGPCSGRTWVEGITYAYTPKNRESWRGVSTMANAGLLEMPQAPEKLAEQVDPNLLALADMNRATISACIEDARWEDEGNPSEYFYERKSGKDRPQNWSDDPAENKATPFNFETQKVNDPDFFWVQRRKGALVVTLRLDVSIGAAQGTQTYRLIEYKGPTTEYETNYDAGEMMAFLDPSKAPNGNFNGAPVLTFATREEAQKWSDQHCFDADGKVRYFPNVAKDRVGSRCLVVRKKSGKFAVYAVILNAWKDKDGWRFRPDRSLFDLGAGEAEVHMKRTRIPMRQAVKAADFTFRKDVGDARLTQFGRDRAQQEITEVFTSLKEEFSTGIESSIEQGALRLALNKIEGAHLVYQRFIELGLTENLKKDGLHALVYGKDQLPHSEIFAKLAREGAGSETIEKVVKTVTDRHQSFWKAYFERTDRQPEDSPFVEGLLQELESFQDESRSKNDADLGAAFEALRNDVRQRIATVPKR